MSKMVRYPTVTDFRIFNFHAMFCNFQLGSVSRFLSDNIVIMAACIRSSENPDVR
jgi:hypothetical protein